MKKIIGSLLSCFVLFGLIVSNPVSAGLTSTNIGKQCAYGYTRTGLHTCSLTYNQYSSANVYGANGCQVTNIQSLFDQATLNHNTYTGSTVSTQNFNMSFFRGAKIRVGERIYSVGSPGYRRNDIILYHNTACTSPYILTTTISQSLFEDGTKTTGDTLSLVFTNVKLPVNNVTYYYYVGDYNSTYVDMIEYYD